jgi:hypothetical protein
MVYTKNDFKKYRTKMYLLSKKRKKKMPTSKLTSNSIQTFFPLSLAEILIVQLVITDSVTFKNSSFNVFDVQYYPIRLRTDFLFLE